MLWRSRWRPLGSRSVEMLDRVHIDSEVRHSVPTRRSENVSRSRSERPAHQGESETRGVSRKRERALPINSARLRPIRQRTRNAVVSVLTSLCFCASVCVCFVFVCVYACLHVCVWDSMLFTWCTWCESYFHVNVNMNPEQTTMYSLALPSVDTAQKWLVECQDSVLAVSIIMTWSSDAISFR